MGWLFDFLAEWVYLFGPHPRGYDWTTGRSDSKAYRILWWYGRFLVWSAILAGAIWLIWSWYVT